MGEWQETNPDEMLARHLAGSMADRNIKKAQREMLRKRMADHPSCDPEPVVKEIAAFLREKPEIKVVAAFVALPGEVDLRALPALVEKVWVFPKVIGEDLVFHEVEDFTNDLEEGAYGILEPRPNLTRVLPDEVDAFLCPGLGFDPRGGRIGRGRGFYDRMLQRARPDAVKLGVCFGHQLVDGIVMENHDVRMNGVIAG